MKAKKFITFGLLAFVAVSLGYLLLNNRQPQESPDISSTNTPAENKLPDEADTETDAAVLIPDEKVVAQYFHGTTRCDTCKAIEALTREALGSGFSEELKSGRLELRAINVDEPANGHFVEDYQLTTRTVVITRFKNGKQGEWKRLDQVWQLVGDRDKFIKYVQAETRSLLEQKS